MANSVDFTPIITAIQTALTSSTQSILAAIAKIPTTGGGLTPAEAAQLQVAATDAAQALTQLNALAAQIAQVDQDVKAISLPPSPPPPPPPPPPNSPPPPPPPPPPSPGPEIDWGQTLPGYDPTIDAIPPGQITTGTNFTAFRKAIVPPLATGQTVTMPAGTMGPGDLIENEASNPDYTNGELYVVGGGAKATDLTIPNLTKSIIDDIGESNPNMPLFWQEAGILVRCQRAHFENLMFYRCADSLTGGDGSAGIRDMPGMVELITIKGCYFLLNGDGVQTVPNDGNIPPSPPPRFPNGAWTIISDSVFGNNGITTDGKSHCCYINGRRVDSSNLTYVNVGHGYCMKSRAPDGTHVNNVMTSINDGGLYDFPQGGIHTIYGGSMTLAATATSKWFLRLGEEGDAYGYKKPAGQNILYVGGGCVINMLRPAGNALQVGAGCTISFDSTCVFNYAPGQTWANVEQDIEAGGQIMINQPPIAAPVIPTIPPLGTPVLDNPTG